MYSLVCCLGCRKTAKVFGQISLSDSLARAVCHDMIDAARVEWIETPEKIVMTLPLTNYNVQATTCPSCQMNPPPPKLQLNKPLPDKLSELITMALADLRTVEQDPAYSIRMDDWHAPWSGAGRSVCNVCLAGAVMACGGASSGEPLSPDSFEADTYRKLMALDSLRRGDVQDAMLDLKMMDHALNMKFRDRFISPYVKGNPEAFYTDMTRLAEDLNTAGL